MIKCTKCTKNMFVDRLYNSRSHIEVYCIYCGTRKFFIPPQNTAEGRWILQKELLRAKHTITPP